MNTTQETEFDYQKHMKESARGPSEINRGTKAREKRREATKTRISQKLQQGKGTTMTYKTQNFKIPHQSDDYFRMLALRHDYY